MRLKRCISSILAILVVAVSLPLNSIVMRANADSAEDAAKIERIKAAWTAMEQISFKLAPNRQIKGFDSYTQAAFSDKSHLPDGAKTNIPKLAGDNYVAMTLTDKNGSTPAAQGAAYMVYDGMQNKPSDYKVHLSFYVASIVEGGEVSFVPYFRSTGATGVGSGKLYTVTSADVGKWVTLDEEDITGDSYKNVPNLNNNIVLAVNSTGTNSIVFGSFVFTKAAVLPDGSDNWNFNEWFASASGLDLSSYYNTDQFLNVLGELETDDTLKIKKIRNAWKSLEEISFEVAPNRQVKGLDSYNQATIGNTTYLPAGAKTEIPAIAGKNYAAITLTDKSGATSDVRGTGEMLFGASANKPSDYNVYFSFYVDNIADGGKISFVPYFRSGISTGIGSGKLYTVTSADVGKWVTLDGEDLAGNSYTNAPNLNNSILLGINSTGTNSVIFSSFVFTKGATLPENSGKWSFEEWLENARALDISSYYNTEQFTSVLTEFETEEYRQIVSLRNAWKSLDEIAFQSNPDKQLNGFDEYTQMAFTDIGYLPAGAKTNIPALIGNSYAVVTLTDKTGSTSDVRGQAYMMFTGVANKPSEYKMRFSFYVDSIADGGEISFVPYFRSTGNTGMGSGKLYTVSAADVGKWITLDEEDLAGSSYTNVSNLNNSLILALNSTGTNSIVLGSFVFTQGATLPENSGKWNLAEWIANAKELDLSAYDNTKQFSAALKAAEQAADDLNIPICKVEEIPTDISTLGENRILGLTPEIKHFSVAASSENAAYEKLSDGDINTAVSMANKTLDANGYVTVKYNIHSFVNAEKLLVSAVSKNAYSYYEVYLSNSENDLFDTKNRLIKINNSAVETASQVLSLYNKLNCSFLGFKFSGPGTDKLELTELGIYGEQSDCSIETGNFSNDKIKNIGYNLISQNNGLYPNNKVDGMNSIVQGYSNKNLCDADARTPYANVMAQWNSGIDDSKSCDIYYDLGASYKINKFFMNQWYQPSLETGKYEIYVANAKDQLFQKSNMVLSYNNMHDSENGTTVSQLFTMADGKEPIGRFVGFRIRCSVSDWELANRRYPGGLYVRLTELGIYGTEYTPPAKPTNLLYHVPIEVFRCSKSDITKIGENELTHALVTQFCDNIYDKGVPISTGGKRLDFVFNLCGSMNVDELSFYALSKQIGGLKIYAADSEEEVWLDSALAYTSDNKTPVSEIVFSPNTSIKARFIRYSVTVNGNVLNVAEINAIGMDNQAHSYRNLILENNQAVSLYSMNYKTGHFSSISEQENKAYASILQRKAFMTDGATDTVFDIYSAKDGESSIDIIVDLGALHAVDTVTLKAGSDENHWPSQMSIYVGENEEQITDKNAKSLYAFSEKSEDGTYKYEMTPRYVRYVRYQITKSQNPYLSAHMLAVISELEIGGMSISGRIAEDAGSVLSFTDKGTSVKVNIMKNDDNDAYSGVAGISVTPADFSLAEKKSLSAHYMMFYGQKYIIKLLDRNGNIVTDVGGRKISVFVPAPSGQDISGIYVVNISGNNTEIKETSIYETKVMTTFDSPVGINVAAAGFVVDYPEDYFTEKVIVNTETEIEKPASDNNIKDQITDDKSEALTNTAVTEELLKLNDKETGITVQYRKDVLPDGVSMIVKECGLEALPDILAKQFKADDFKAFGITFVCDGKDVAPNDLVRVFIPLPAGMKAENCKVFYIVDGKKSITDMNAEFSDGGMTFLTKDTGVYMISDAEFDTTGTRKTVIKNKSNSDGDFSYIYVIIGLAALVLVGTALTLWIIFVKRKKKKEE